MPTAQTSKDILDDAAKTLKKNETAEMGVDDALKQADTDIAAFGKGKAELGTSIGSIKRLSDVTEDRLKELNKGLTILQKNEAVMKAPADAKAYAKLVDGFEQAIESGMKYDTKLTATT